MAIRKIHITMRFKMSTERFQTLFMEHNLQIGIWFDTLSFVLILHLYEYCFRARWSVIEVGNVFVS